MLIFYANCPLGMSGSTERTDAFPAGTPNPESQLSRPETRKRRGMKIESSSAQVARPPRR